MKDGKTFYKKPILLLIAMTWLTHSNIVFAADAKTPIILKDVTGKTGITFRHVDGSGGNLYIMEFVSAGLALFDYDNDGDIDIYFLNGAALKGTDYKTVPRNALYRNDGKLKFTDVTDISGLGDTGFGLGVAVGDYDNDGHADVYVNNYGPNVLYRNNGNGTFSDVTGKAGVGGDDNVGAGVNFLDMDNDGDLDLYVSNYVLFSYDKHVVVMRGLTKMYASPTAYPYPADSLYRNNGDGTFTDVSHVSGIGDHRGTGMGTVCFDYDDDGDTDIFVANDSMENYLFENDGAGKFEEMALMAGVAYDLNGKPQGNMGVDCGDYDNDGLLDLYVTSYSREWAVLYKNLGKGMFEDVTFSTGSGEATYADATWGTGFADFDHDGDRDIFVAVGHLQPEVHSDLLTYLAQNELLMNTGDGKFVNVTDTCGEGLQVKQSSRGAAFDDLDNDGDIDVVVLNSRSEPTILENVTNNDNHWLQVRLVGKTANRSGVGARVKVTAGKLTQIDEVHSGRGYQSHYGLRLYFGLGNHSIVESLEVIWPGGKTDRYQDIPVDRIITLTQN
ncbi:MAG: CRTAC1 family protein [Planctomycetota bacterium]